MRPDKPIKICFLLPSHYSSNLGGAEYQVKLILDHLQNRNSNRIFYLSKHVSDNFPAQGYQVIQVKNGLNQWINRKSGLLLDCSCFYRKLKVIQPDVIYQRVGCALTGVSAYYARKHGKSFLFHVSSDFDVKPEVYFGRKRDYAIKYIGKKMLEYGLRHASKIIVQSKNQHEALWKNYGIRSSILIRNFHPLPETIEKDENRIKIIWIANLKKLKRPEIFLKLARVFLSIPHVEFIMIGKKDAQMRNPVLEKEISDLVNLNYLGKQPFEQTNRILSRCHILVNTSVFEGFPNTFIQAWLRKLPVVSLDVDPDNLLEKEKMGYHSKSFTQMVEDIQRLVQDSELRQKLGQKAHKYAIQNHSLANIQQLVRLFNVN